MRVIKTNNNLFFRIGILERLVCENDQYGDRAIGVFPLGTISSGKDFIPLG